jgi:hypothetical protein
MAKISCALNQKGRRADQVAGVSPFFRFRPLRFPAERGSLPVQNLLEVGSSRLSST